MVARVVSTEGVDQVNIPRLLHNIEKVYQYRSIEDDDVYKDENMRRLVMNYGSGFVKAAIHFTQKQGLCYCRKVYMTRPQSTSIAISNSLSFT
jgi:hypothetical protein